MVLYADQTRAGSCASVGSKIVTPYQPSQEAGGRHRSPVRRPANRLAPAKRQKLHRHGPHPAGPIPDEAYPGHASLGHSWLGRPMAAARPIGAAVLAAGPGGRATGHAVGL